MDRQLELLAPAKNADYGIEAIRHGADAVYIGAPSFGARAGAGNSLEDIERLISFAHIFGAKVYVALNTILKDEELSEARKLIHQLYNIGADAIIIQDYGLLMLDLPPIPLHASTQMDNVSVERIKFISDQGFEQVVIPREFSLNQIRRVHRTVPDIRLECFVHGALCVSYSGRCYAAAEFHDRSANRGACSQVCRLPFDLIDGKGRVLQRNKHLLSIKDLNRTELIADLIEAGVTSFKIEGRLKDLSYVKNVVSHYNLVINAFIAEHPEYSRRSHGEVDLKFIPQIDRVFNRGYTAFAQNGRKEDNLAAFDSPKSMGERVGTVTSIKGSVIRLQREPGKIISNGDGLAFYLPQGGTSGIKVNVSEGDKITLNKPSEDLKIGMSLYRNFDIDFERQMAKETAERKLPIHFCLYEQEDNKLCLSVETFDGIRTSVVESIKMEKSLSGDAITSITNVLNKCGNTFYKVSDINISPGLDDIFIPRSLLTGMRQKALGQLNDELRSFALKIRPTRPQPLHDSTYPEATVNYTANVFNRSAQLFYAKHGSTVTEMAYEMEKRSQKPLMYTKHCIRYSLGMCPHLQGYQGCFYEPWLLKSTHGDLTMRISFNCRECSMSLYKY